MPAGATTGPVTVTSADRDDHERGELSGWRRATGLLTPDTAVGGEPDGRDRDKGTNLQARHVETPTR